MYPFSKHGGGGCNLIGNVRNDDLGLFFNKYFLFRLETVLQQEVNCARQMSDASKQALFIAGDLMDRHIDKQIDIHTDTQTSR